MDVLEAVTIAAEFVRTCLKSHEKVYDDVLEKMHVSDSTVEEARHALDIFIEKADWLRREGPPSTPEAS